MKFNLYICSMNKILISITLLFSTLLLSQTKDDVIDFKKINLKLLDSLVFEEAMKERKKANVSRMKHDEVCGESAKYQSEYMSHYSVFSHENHKIFRNVLLEKHSDRFNYFLKNKKTKKEYKNKMEILFQYKNVTTINYMGIDKKTYQNYAEDIIKNFMSSKFHKIALLYDMINYGNMCGEYKTHYNPNTDCLSVTGFFVLEYKGYSGKDVISFDNF